MSELVVLAVSPESDMFLVLNFENASLNRILLFSMLQPSSTALFKSVFTKSMDARTGPKIRTGPDKLRGPDFSVRIFLVRSVVRIFRSGFFRSGPWSGFSGPDFFGPVRGPDISVRIFTGPVRSPDFSVRIIRTGPDFFVVRSVVRIFFQNKKNPDRTNFA